jgi:small-conductance mechanosensitive channel
MTIEELKSKIEKAEKSLSSPMLQANPAVLESVKKNIENYKKQLAELEAKTEKKVEQAEKKIEQTEKKVEQAETEKEKKEAKAELKQAQEEIKKVEEEVKEVEKVTEQISKVEKKAKHGGSGRGQGRKKGSKNKKSSSVTKMVKPAKYKPKRPVRKFVKRVVVKKKAKVAVKPAEKMKSVRAFGQNVQYKNDAEFCKKLINAFKKRKAVSKKLRKKTKPVFGIITTKVKDAVSKAIDNTPKNVIEKNPKAFLAKAQRLEKSAIRFLEDFKAILGADFKKSEISAEFGDLEKSIKKLVAKYKK